MALIVAVEGLPGCGKTTIIQMMMADLRQKGIRTGMADIETVGYAPALRAAARTHPLGHPARILLFWALRLQQSEIMQKLSESIDIGFFDRFWGSTVVYDLYGNGVPREIVDWIGRHITHQAGLTLFLDVPLLVAQQRKESTTMRNLDFAQRVERGYKKLAADLSWTRVDATRPTAEVEKQCLEIILSARR